MTSILFTIITATVFFRLIHQGYYINAIHCVAPLYLRTYTVIVLFIGGNVLGKMQFNKARWLLVIKNTHIYKH